MVPIDDSNKDANLTQNNKEKIIFMISVVINIVDIIRHKFKFKTV